MRVPLLLAVSVLAGCFHAEPEGPGPAPSSLDNVSATDVVPPPAIVTDETNRTVNGTGGKPHVHDYWAGRGRVDVLTRDVVFQLLPVFPEGGPGNVFAAEIDLPPGVLVYEGTGKVELLATKLDPTLTGLKVRVKTARDVEFRPPVPMRADEPLVLDIEPEETDMPHATNSLWEFRFLADGTSPVGYGRFNLTLSVVKARDVANWPGHPDFYGGKAARVVLDREAGTKQVGVNDAWVYGADANNVPAERLVSMGTRELVVFVNVSSGSSPAGEPQGYFLEYRNATGDWRRVRDEANYTTTAQRFHVPVHPDGLDSPYAQQSRWQFRVLAVFAVTPAVDAPEGVPDLGQIGICPGCFPYELAYRITALALPHPDPEAGATG